MRKQLRKRPSPLWGSPKQAAAANTGQPVSGHQPHCERMRNGTAAFLNSVNEAPKIETTASFDEAAFREFQKSSSFCRACVHREIVTRRIEPIASRYGANGFQRRFRSGR